MVNAHTAFNKRTCHDHEMQEASRACAYPAAPAARLTVTAQARASKIRNALQYYGVEGSCGECSNNTARYPGKEAYASRTGPENFEALPDHCPVRFHVTQLQDMIASQTHRSGAATPRAASSRAARLAFRRSSYSAASTFARASNFWYMVFTVSRLFSEAALRCTCDNTAMAC
jgi:hypothetical protein